MIMKTIEERAKEWGEHIVETTPYDVVDGKACVFVEDRNIADIAEESYIAGAKEQKAIDDEVTLKGFTTDELRAELKRRNAEEKAKKESILRCRMCRHWGAIDYWGNPGYYLERDTSRCCRFFHTKNGKYYRCHNASQLACDHFERKEE